MKIMEMMLGVVMGVVDMEVDKWPMRWRTGPTLLMWPWRAKIPIECFTGVTLAIEMMLEVEVTVSQQQFQPRMQITQDFIFDKLICYSYVQEYVIE